MDKFILHYLFMVGNGNNLRRLNKVFHDVLHYIDRIYFPEEYEIEKRMQEFRKNESAGNSHASNKVIL